MADERPLEVLMTHTSEELRQALAQVRTEHAPRVYRGKQWQLTPERYAQEFLRVQEKWKNSLNCWSGSASIAGRVLSNWYWIDEGIRLFGNTYDTTEHFWQAVKYAPEVRPRDLLDLLEKAESVNWEDWLEALSNDQQLYLGHTYRIEFLRYSLKPARRQWFRQELRRYAQSERTVRQLLERDARRPREVLVSASEVKSLWGDLGALLHLADLFARANGGRFERPELQPLLDEIRRLRFDAIYLGDRRLDFDSADFRELMLEIWKAKFLEIRRFGEVIRSTKGLRLEHFLNDGGSSSIPIPLYVEYLNQVREMAFRKAQAPRRRP